MLTTTTTTHTLVRFTWFTFGDTQVRNRMLTKAQTERIVKECWMTKQRVGNRVPLPDFFRLFLQRQFPQPVSVAEREESRVALCFPMTASVTH